MTFQYTGKVVGRIAPAENMDWCDHGAELARIALHAVEAADVTSPPADFEIDEGGTQLYEMLCRLHHLTDRLGLSWRTMLHLASWRYQTETDQQPLWDLFSACPQCGSSIKYTLTAHLLSDAFHQCYVQGSAVAICDEGHQLTNWARDSGVEDFARDLLD